MAPIDPFAFTRGRRNAPVLIVGEAWGANEDEQKKPFVGASGQELERMLKESGINPADCLFTNVVDSRPARNEFYHFLYTTADGNKEKMPKVKGVFPRKILLDGVDKLHRLIAELKPKLIIATGNWPLWALCDSYKIKDEDGYKMVTGIDTYRGSMLYHTPATPGAKAIPLLPTYHPAAVFRQWKWRHIAVRDFSRAASFLSGQLPWEDRRDFKWLIHPRVRQVRDWVDRFLSQPQQTLDLILDLETFAGRIHIFGVKTRHDGTCLCVPFMHVRDIAKNGAEFTLVPTYSQQEFAAIYGHLRRLLTDPRVRLLGQNLTYDIQYLAYYFCYTPTVGDDTMVMQHVLSPGERKGLDFLASVYCTFYSYWKEDRKVSLNNESTEDGCRYNCLDLEYTDEVARVLRPFVTRLKEEQYQKKIRLLHQLFRMMQRGVRQDMERRRMQTKYLEHMIQDTEDWLEGSMPDHIKPTRLKTKTGKWKTAAWYASEKQLKTLLHDTLKIKPVWDPDTRRPTLNKAALGTLAKREPALAVFFNMLVLLRSLYTYKANFYDARVSPDGRMRCAYNVAGTVSFRLASSEDVFGDGHNLQNVPRDRNPLDFFNIIAQLS
jgi:uracil-DNA glycosylase